MRKGLHSSLAVSDSQDRSQQDRTIAQLQVDGWKVLDPAQRPDDGSVLMQLTTPGGVSHIIVMLNGDRVDARQRLGKNPAAPDKGEP